MVARDKTAPDQDKPTAENNAAEREAQTAAITARAIRLRESTATLRVPSDSEPCGTATD